MTIKVKLSILIFLSMINAFHSQNDILSEIKELNKTLDKIYYYPESTERDLVIYAIPNIDSLVQMDSQFFKISNPSKKLIEELDAWNEPLGSYPGNILNTIRTNDFPNPDEEKQLNELDDWLISKYEEGFEASVYILEIKEYAGTVLKLRNRLDQLNSTKISIQLDINDTSSFDIFADNLKASKNEETVRTIEFGEHGNGISGEVSHYEESVTMVYIISSAFGESMQFIHYYKQNESIKVIDIFGGSGYFRLYFNEDKPFKIINTKQNKEVDFNLWPKYITLHSSLMKIKNEKESSLQHSRLFKLFYN